MRLKALISAKDKNWLTIGRDTHYTLGPVLLLIFPTQNKQSVTVVMYRKLQYLGWGLDLMSDTSLGFTLYYICHPIPQPHLVLHFPSITHNGALAYTYYYGIYLTVAIHRHKYSA